MKMRGLIKWHLGVVAMLVSSMLTLVPVAAQAAFTIKAVDATTGVPVSGFRWLVEEDNSNQAPPGVRTAFSIGLDIHKSHAPVLANGHTADSSAVVDLPADKLYYVSVLPDSASTQNGYTLGGNNVVAGQVTVTVPLNRLPTPTAQIFVLAFNDNFPINNAYDMPAEPGLGGFTIVIDDAFGGGPISADAFGNPLGTVYQQNCDAAGANPGSGTDFCLNADGTPVSIGALPLLTMTAANVGNPVTNPYNLKVGEALVKNLYPGKYGVRVIPPQGQLNWQQTTTIEGTPVIDAWVKADEPRIFVEGFGTGTHHVQFGFIDPTTLPGIPVGGTSSISGRNVYNHFSRPPFLQGFYPGVPVSECWIGLNDPVSGQGLYATACDANSNFTIPNVPPGTYQLVTWDKPLGALFGFNTVTVPPGGGAVNLGNVLSFKWFGHLEGTVFFDVNENGFRDPGEIGISQQNINIRFRDGSIYMAAPTAGDGSYELPEVFPFFKWLVTEVDYARFKATGMTAAFDKGGVIPPANGWIMPSFDKLNPIPDLTGLPNVINEPEINPNTGNNYSRTETGPVLLQAMHLFLGQTNVIDWGKKDYAPGENGGISGIVFYAVTRAEDEAVNAFAEGFEPGVPRVQVNLYRDTNGDRIIDDVNGDGVTLLADVDNYPFGWRDGGAIGPEDTDRNSNGVFDFGDALNIVTTDSWDDNPPSGCYQKIPVINGQQAKECFDNFGTWNQVRPGVFDGGYSFVDYWPGGMANPVPGTDPNALPPLPAGTYIVEAVPPPNYIIQKEEDKNVVFGDSFKPSLKALPQPCVGDSHTVPAFLSLFPNLQEPVISTVAGQSRPLCDRRQVRLDDRLNAAADFFVFTEVPKAARAVGFANNDLAPEFDPNSPIFGEKSSPKWIPISFQDYAGNEVYRTYTDEYGAYNALLPSTFSTQVPSPSGLMPNMLTVFLNHPFMPDPNDRTQRISDPFYDPRYSQMAWTFMYSPGKTSYLDTPILPIGAFVGHPDFGLDTEPPDKTPKIHSVTGNMVSGPSQKGPLLCADNDTITITSAGTRQVANPAFSNEPGNAQPALISRDFGFSFTQGRVSVLVDGAIGNPVSLEIVSWSPSKVVARVPAGSIGVGGTLGTGLDRRQHQLILFRGDNGKWTELGITLHVGNCNSVVHVSPGQSIQSAVDAIPGAGAGEVIIVPPGMYNEAVIINKNVKLQGWGAESTAIYAYPRPLDKLTSWHAKVKGIVDTAFAADPTAFPNIILNPVTNTKDAFVTFNPIEMPGFLILFPHPVFDLANPGLIDGFTISGSISGGGVHVHDNGSFLRISNNIISGNQGNRGGGIVLGIPDTGTPVINDSISIHHNQIVENAGITEGGGGISIFAGASNYSISDNRIAGNFTRKNGGGICHEGLSHNGMIERNKVLFNEVFFGGPVGGEGGGIYLGSDIPPNIVIIPGQPLPLLPGTGTVTLNANLIQGNLAGSGHGGGIRVDTVNGLELDPAESGAVTALEADWYRLNIFNNMIINNVSAYAGGGIYLEDAVRATVVNNTIAHNDSTATAQAAMLPGILPVRSTPQGVGIVTTVFGATIASEFANAALPLPAFTDPVLVNNIIWENRSYSWDGSLNNSQGGLVAAPGIYNDLQVSGTAGAMNPQNCFLTSTAGYAAGNFQGLPGFKAAYFNNLLFGTVADEGGNFISARFNPLTPAAGDYHLRADAPAKDKGADSFIIGATPIDLLRNDIDTDSRVGQTVDIGADEFNNKGDVNGDNIVNMADVLLTLRRFVDPAYAIPQPANLDVFPLDLFGRPTGSGGAPDISDVLLVLRRALGLVNW